MNRTASQVAAERIECQWRAARLWLSCASTIVLILCGAAATLAQSASSATAVQSAKRAAPTPASAGASAKAPAPANGMSTGIKVHGHWIIEVHNPDGSLVTHREFENQIQIAGVATLAGLLARVATPGSWAIGLGDAVSPPCNSAMGFVSFFSSEQGAGAEGCFIGESAGAYSTPCTPTNSCSPNLSLSAFVAGSVGETIPPAGQAGYDVCGADNATDVPPCDPFGPFSILGFQLKGYAVAQRSGQVTLVETALMGCGPGVGTLACAAPPQSGVVTATSNMQFSNLAGYPGTGASQLFTNFGSIFTGTYVPGPAIQVGAQQAVNVTVQITFQ